MLLRLPIWKSRKKVKKLNQNNLRRKLRKILESNPSVTKLCDYRRVTVVEKQHLEDAVFVL